MCIDLYGGKENAPCKLCRPETHKFNVPVVELYLACHDQLIMGFSGPVAINDIAITNAMEKYYKVRKRDMLELSQLVRGLFQEIMKFTKEKSDG